jgi:hypothetical protein
MGINEAGRFTRVLVAPTAPQAYQPEGPESPLDENSPAGQLDHAN